MARPRVAGDHCRHDPDRACARDEHVLTEHRERERGVDRVAERVEDGGHIEVDSGLVAPHVRGRQRDVLGERARVVHADAVGAGALNPPARHTVAAATTDEMALAAHEVALGEILHVRAERDDLADELVTDHEWRRHILLSPAVPLVDVQVGPADPGPQHADEHLVPPDRRVGDFLQREPRLGA